jgi:formyltetrahydrofolate deformylase
VDAGCNLTDSAQFDDREAGTTLPALIDGFGEIAATYDMAFQFHGDAEKMKILLMASKLGHCLNDILYRWKIGGAAN